MEEETNETKKKQSKKKKKQKEKKKGPRLSGGVQHTELWQTFLFSFSLLYFNKYDAHKLMSYFYVDSIV